VGAFANYESCYAQIKNTVEQNNLEKFMYDDFLNIFWGSFIKR
jgi:hypothetical protein